MVVEEVRVSLRGRRDRRSKDIGVRHQEGPLKVGGEVGGGG